MKFCTFSEYKETTYQELLWLSNQNDEIGKTCSGSIGQYFNLKTSRDLSVDGRILKK
jgi:hypothetical protein